MVLALGPLKQELGVFLAPNGRSFVKNLGNKHQKNKKNNNYRGLKLLP